jgi:hypothetical protein
VGQVRQRGGQGPGLLDHEYGHLYSGKAKVKATLTDPQDEEASDSEHVKLKVKKK